VAGRTLRAARLPFPSLLSDPSTVSAFSDYIVYADESGDHGLASVDPQYPVFVLAFCLFGKEAYAARAAAEVAALKFRHFGHDLPILHEHDIRKTRGHFRFLTDAARRECFFADLNRLMAEAPFVLIASAIRKEALLARSTVVDNPYHLAMGFCLERLALHLRAAGARGTTHVVFECRGAREDAELEREFRRVCGGANVLREPLPFEIVLADKKCNSAGLQLADLVARPIGRRILAPAQPNRAYDILQARFRRSPAGKVDGWG
jgi:hypothetical protein